MDSLTHSEATIQCTLAAFGDVVILLVAFWIISLIAKSRHWIIHPKTTQVIGFIAIGMIITVILEAIAIHVFDRWQYAAVMPTLPMIGTGLTPILQWLIIPTITLSRMRCRRING